VTDLVTGAGPDLETLRLERLARLQAAMRAHDVEVCLLSNEPNVRYATGASAMPVYAMSTFVRCAVVPQEGTPILFEHGNSVHRSALRAPDVRTMHAWEFFDDPQEEADGWAEEILAAITEIGAVGATVAVDRLGAPAFLALTRRAIAIRDSAPVTQEARRVKTAQELSLLGVNATMVMEMLAAFEAAIEPGVSERELLAVLAGVMLRRGGEYLATNTVCGGPNTNPWRAEATSRRLEPGELVYVDTDTVGIEGMFFCVSRTFPVGGSPPSPEQRDVYRASHEWLRAMEALIRPGLTCGELAGLTPPIPEPYLAQRYECMVHGIGLEEEDPSVCHPLDRQSNADTMIEQGMALVVELYAGESGGRDGVKLGDQIVVTSDGCRVLCPYPFSAELLG
jgi:Xaa-Pro aminopeptidase